ncbi:MAG TPA: hypothetical protein VGN20_16405 [Mucilaginibacter sp.]|jgi:hypothetical protein
MLLNHQDSLSHYSRLFHISEKPGIGLFEPRPSPSHFDSITGDCVYAISGTLLHNYLLPRDCPRVTYYLADETTESDKEKFFGNSAASHIVIVESDWYQRIRETTLFCYEFSNEVFALLDECAGYYISYKPVIPLSVSQINDIMAELLNRNIELRFTPSLIKLANDVVKSSLNFSIIRMRNAKA